MVCYLLHAAGTGLHHGFRRGKHHCIHVGSRVSDFVIIAVTAAYSLNLNRTVSRLNAAIHTLDAENGTGNTDSCAGRRKGGLITLERDTEQIVRSIAAVVDARYRDRLAISEYQMESLQAQISRIFLQHAGCHQVDDPGQKSG